MPKRQKRRKRRARRPRRVTSRRPSPRQFTSGQTANTLRLKCEPCGSIAEYDVGTILIDEDYLSDSPQSSLEDSLSFTRYFRCRSCGAGGPWRLTHDSHFELMGLLLRGLHSKLESGPLQVGAVQLFDGTRVRYPTDGEAHLRSLIEASPEDPYLRDRLGNLFDHTGRPDLALEAYREALAIDPSYLPSLYSTGKLLAREGRDEEAAEALHAMLRAAKRATYLDLGERRRFVRSALEMLFDLHIESDGRVAFLPTAKPDEIVRDERGQATLFVRSFDLDSERDWDKLVDWFVRPPARGGRGRRGKRRRVTRPQPGEIIDPP